MTTMTALATQVYQVFIKADPGADLGRDHEAGVHGEVLLRRAGDRDAGRATRAWTGTGNELVVGEVSEFDPPRRLVHEWRSLYDPEMAAEQASRVTWEIETQEGGYSLLTVVHDQLESSPKTAESVSGVGWMLVLSGLKTVLETGKGLTG